MTKICLIGDSTTQTYYLRASQNPLLVSNWGKPSGFDMSLDGCLKSALGAGYEIANLALGGRYAKQAYTENFSYVANGTYYPITADLPMWTVCKQWNPDIVVFNFGINDQSKSNLTDFTTYVSLMLSEAAALGYRVIVWDGMHYQWGATDEHGGATVNANLDPYLDALTDMARQHGAEVVGTRALFADAIDGGSWDLFGHNDGSMLSGWDAAVGPLYANVHQWIGGQEIIAAAIADAIENPPYHLDLTLGVVPKVRRRQRIALGGV